MDLSTEDAWIPEAETIAALSTPSGEGGIGVIRISGTLAVEIALQLFRLADGSALVNPISHRLYYGNIVNPADGAIVDEVLLSVMRAPHSYTRENVVEISAHGGREPLREILKLLFRLGVTPAAAGEFTQRAYLNGRIDLTQAEAVMDTIRAHTDAGLRAAQTRLAGALGLQVRELRGRIICLLASIEAAIDFAEEDITFLTPEEIFTELTALFAEVNMLAESYTRGKLLREGAVLALIGRTNTGKSSLLNALLGEARAIVTDVPGTTRDVIEEGYDLGGIPVRLVDTAGIRHTHDVVEKIGVERSRESLASADLILLVCDGSQALNEEDLHLLEQVQQRPHLLVVNKSDMPVVLTDEVLGAYDNAPMVNVSALTGAGLEQLQTMLRQLLLGDAIIVSTPALATERQHDAARRSAAALERTLATLADGGTEELLAVDLREAATALGEITGDDTGEEVIAEIFSRFCVGK